MYEISKTDVNFYSVERAGYFNVGDLVIDAVSDMLQLGAFTLSNVTITDSTGQTLNTVPWPPVERLITITTPGAGYRIDDVVQIQYGELAANANIKITGINTLNGAVTSARVQNTGDLYNHAQATGQPTKFFVPAGTSSIALSATGTPPFEKFTLRGAASNTVGTSPTIIPASDTTYAAAADFNTLYGSTGQYGKWPTNGIWTDKEYSTINTLCFVGQEVLFDQPGITSSGLSNIPPGTKITGIFPIPVVNGTRQRTGLRENPTAAAPYTEKTILYTWFTFSNPVTIRMDDVITVRGAGLEVSDTTSVTPAGYKVIVEAAGGVDPLNDPVGVYGDVVSETSSSTTVLIDNLTPRNAFNPVIYAGQSVISTEQVGTVAGAVTVVSVVSTGPTTAIVTLSSQQSLAAGETLQFVFDEAQPWRLAFDVQVNTSKPEAGPQTVAVYAATSNQLNNLGQISDIWDALGVTKIDKAGAMGAKPTGTAGAINPLVTTEGFLNRATRVNVNPEVYPLNYALTMTNRGIFFGIWEGTWSTIQKTVAKSTSDKDNYFNWFLVQRPVNRYTGQVLTTGLCPVFCINSVGYKYWKFIVREADILHPSLGDPDNKRDFVNSSGVQTTELCSYRVPADAHTQDSFAVLNTTNQIALTEDSKYLISFLHNLTTPRFRYSEELDMIGQTSADVCMAGTDISITAYSESGPRIYRALPANNPYNTGLRICVIKNIPA
jgi:hypothetical protein